MTRVACATSATALQTLHAAPDPELGALVRVFEQRALAFPAALAASAAIITLPAFLLVGALARDEMLGPDTRASIAVPLCLGAITLLLFAIVQLARGQLRQSVFQYERGAIVQHASGCVAFAWDDIASVRAERLLRHSRALNLAIRLKSGERVSIMPPLFREEHGLAAALVGAAPH